MNNPEAPDRIPVEEVLDLVRRVYAKQAPKSTISLTLVSNEGVTEDINFVEPDPDYNDMVRYWDTDETWERVRLDDNCRVIKITYELP